MHPIVHMMASTLFENADFNSDANFNHFVREWLQWAKKNNVHYDWSSDQNYP